MADARLSPWHISLYYSLFQYWNMAKFHNPVSISRSELMLASKIGSANTYTKCLRELDAWGYLKYNPSYNPHLGSQVYMYTFDKGSDNSTDNGSDKGTGHGTDKASVIAVIPYINNLNNTNSLNKRKRENSHSHSKKNNHEKSKKKIQVTPKTKIQKQGKKEKFREKKKAEASAEVPSLWSEPVEGAASGKKDSLSFGEGREGEAKPSDSARLPRPLLQQVLSFFKEKAWPELEAQKYFNHYQSNGWLVGGKTPMNDWQASAEKWMLNNNNFKQSNSSGQAERSRSPGNLQTTTNKNYNEPL